MCTRAVPITRLQGFTQISPAAFTSNQSQIHLFYSSGCCLLPLLLLTHWMSTAFTLNRFSCCLQAGVAASRSLEEVAHSHRSSCCLQAGVAASRSLEEVAELEKAMCLLIQRAADIYSMGEAERAVHAEASTLNVGDGSADGGKTAVSATSELITPEVEKQLPRSARRVRIFFLGELAKQTPW